MQGFLAYRANQVIGWLGVDDAKRFKRLEGDFNYPANQLTAIITCLLIHPDFRGQGLSQTMIEFALQDLDTEGFHQVLVEPFVNPDDPTRSYRGSARMYERLGFEVVEKGDDWVIYGKTLTTSSDDEPS